MLAIDGVMSFSQLINLQNLHKNTGFQSKQELGKLYALFKMAGLLKTRIYSYFFNLIVCEKRNKFTLAVIYCLIYISLSVGQL